MLYTVEFQKDTLQINLSEKKPGRLFTNKAPVTEGSTIITILDENGKAVYQTSLPLIPQQGEEYPVMIPVDNDNAVMLAEGVKDGYKFKRLGSTILKR